MKRLLSIFLAVVFVLMLLLPSSVAFASEEVQYPFDYSSIEDDFEGKAFSEMFDTDKDISLYFMEYAYSPYLSSDYALYVYVYNSTGIVFDAKSDDNRLQFSVNYDTEGNAINFGKYALEYCSQTDDGLITKYRVNCNVYSQLDESARKYFVSSIELDTENGAKDYAVALKYTFTGFAKGYGSEESTLVCSVEEFTTISLNVGHTHYRVQTDTVGEYEDIQSVYFNIPNSYISEYGNIYSLSAVWKEAFTTPILVVDDKEVLGEFEALLRKDVEDATIAFGYKKYHYPTIQSTDKDSRLAAFFNQYTASLANVNVLSPYGVDIDGRFNRLNYCFYSNSTFEPENELVDPTTLLNYLKACNYAEDMFEAIDLTYYTPEAPQEFFAKDLNNVESYEVLNLWEILKSFGTVTTIKNNDVEFTTIQELNSSFADEDSDVFAEEYYVQEDDVLDIQNTMSSDETTYLFRYTVTPYYAYDAYVFDSSGTPVECDAIAVQTTAILDFDIIDVTFYKDGVYTTLAAVSDPTSYVSSITVPTTPGIVGCDCEENCWFCEGNCGNDCDCFWSYIGLLFCGLIVIVVFVPFLPYIISFVAKLISLLIQLLLLPFKVIANLFKKRKNKDDENRRE